MESFRIAGAAGFWGDRNDALSDQIHAGPVDAVMLDYLAEVTMSILRRKLERNPAQGYATDFITALEPALDTVAARGIQVLTNAGGMNPRACAESVLQLCRSQGVRGMRVGVIEGDDLFDGLDGLSEAGVSLENLDTGEPFAGIRDRVLSANAYLGAAPIVQALCAGAQIVITGRCTDSALALAPLIARFGWEADDFDRLAAGTVAGHLLECGGQASGGNFAGGWQDVPGLDRLGYPIAEVNEDGSMLITRHAGLGGRVTPAVLKEQLLYEIGDPRAYLTPDVSVDFTSIQLGDLGNDRVRVWGVTGNRPPDELKASLSYQDGWRNVASLLFVWPHAEARARAAAEVLLSRCRHLGLSIDEHRVELVGVSSAHAHMTPPAAAEPNELLLRVAIRTRDRDSARRFGHEIAPLITSGLPGACGGPGLAGRPDPAPIINFWPALVPRDVVTPRVEVLES
jgi:hypothetical protein